MFFFIFVHVFFCMLFFFMWFVCFSVFFFCFLFVLPFFLFCAYCWIAVIVCSGDVFLLACSVCSFFPSTPLFCVFPSTLVSRKACNLARAIAKYAGSFLCLSYGLRQTDVVGTVNSD